MARGFFAVSAGQVFCISRHIDGTYRAHAHARLARLFGHRRLVHGGMKSGLKPRIKTGGKAAFCPVGPGVLMARHPLQAPPGHGLELEARTAPPCSVCSARLPSAPLFARAPSQGPVALSRAVQAKACLQAHGPGPPDLHPLVRVTVVKLVRLPQGLPQDHRRAWDDAHL